MKWFLINLTFLGLVICVSCSRPIPTLSTAEEVLLDSLYTQKTVEVQAEMDSLCALERDRLFRKMVDSIAEQRLAEIYQIID